MEEGFVSSINDGDICWLIEIHAICRKMERLESLELEAWKEVARHAGVQDVLQALSPRLTRDLPGASLRIRAVDPARTSLDTVAAFGRNAASGRDTLEPADWHRLVAWASEGEVLAGSAREIRSRVGAVIGKHERADFRIGPLVDGANLIGVAILASADRARLGPQQTQRLDALLAPLAAALANERRIHEIGTLREAAEADRRSLLTRLGRRDIGETLIGAEGGLATVMERLVLVADSDVPVLLLGETGSGKEVVARAMRNRSRRAAGPFVRVNCGAIPAGLIDSELFGHERGSFSGAVSQRQGWFERADGGTLFLDEVGELPLEAQVRLLRVLQDGTFERVGGQRPVHVDVRVIAATHRNLRAMVREGQFREDLWYRLAVFPIEIPPLRDRPEDIASLATHFALRACERFGSRALAPTPADLEVLARYDWPGNVRELAAVLDRAVILGGGERLEVAKALGPFEPTFKSPSHPDARPASRRNPAEVDAPFPSLDRAMALHIEAALARCEGRIEGPSGAARLLEINPHPLRARMRKLGVDWNLFREAPHASPRPPR